MDPNNSSTNNQQPMQPKPPTSEPAPALQTPQNAPPAAESQPQPPPDYFQPAAANEPPKTPPTAPEPIEQPAPEPNGGVIPPKKKSNTGLVIILILIILITLGVLGYILLNYLGYIGGSQTLEQPPAQTQEITLPQPTIASSSADNDIEALGNQSDSDEVEVIEADITGTDFTNLDKEVDSINNQL